MPHIDDTRKEQVLNAGPEEPGDLAYILSQVIEDYLADDINFARLNEIVGVLETVKFEFQRRFLAQYEDFKMRENGDAFAALQKVLDSKTGW